MKCLVFVLLSSISWGAENLRMIEWSSILGDAAIQEIVDYRTEARLASLERLADAGGVFRQCTCSGCCVSRKFKPSI